MANEKFNCAVCGGSFEKARSDEEAAAECRELLGVDPLDPKDAPCDLVCDDCWKKMGFGNVV